MNEVLFDHKKFDLNYALGGKRIFLMLKANGSFSAPLCRYISTLDFGGVWIPGYRITGPVFFGIKKGNEMMNLSNYAVKTRYCTWGIEVEFAIGPLKIIQKIFPAKDNGVAFSIFDFKGLNREANFYISGKTWMSSSQGYGILPPKLKILVGKNGFGFSDGILSGAIGLNQEAETNICPGREHIPEEIKVKHLTAFSKTYGFLTRTKVNPDTDELVLAFLAGKESPRSLLKRAKSIPQEFDKYLKERAEHYHKVLYQRAPVLSVPDKNIKKAYEASLVGLEMLKGMLPDGTCGVCAGYPWYSEFWSRDTGWIIPAMIHSNDFEWVEKVLGTMFKWQARYDIKPLAMEKGALPLNLVYLIPPFYGCVDGPLYYPILLEMLVNATGNSDYVKRWWKNVKRIYLRTVEKDSDGDGFLETHASKTWMTDDTWMDTENRSEKPIDIQALWIRALKSIEFLAGNDQKTKSEARQLYNKLKEKFSKVFWNEKDYFYDTIRPDGEPDLSTRPNALVALIFELVSQEKANKAIQRMNQSDILTLWGIRTRSEEDPLYDPNMYHSGEVWGSTTGWGALAAFTYGANEIGKKIISIQAERILEEEGMYAECYRGNKPEIYQSCILQAWSLSTYLWCVSEKLFGISKKALEKAIDISPNIPEEWSDAKIKNIVVGNATLNIKVNGETKKIEVENVGRENITVRTNKEKKIVNPGGIITVTY